MAKNGINWSIADLERMKAAGTIQGYTVLNAPLNVEDVAKPKAKKSKYSNEATVVDGIRFDSVKEAKRYRVLLLLQKSGAIGQLRLQVPYELNEGGTHSYKYIADFVYMDATSGETIVEDAKGFRTREYKKKRKLMKKLHGIVIKEV